MVLKKKDKKKKPEKTTPKMKEEIAEELINKLPPPEEKNKPPKWPGRKEKITENILQKLKVCFAVGMTDPQACYFCQISERTLYNYQVKNPEFVQEKEILKTSISLQAKFNIWRTIKIEEAKAYWWTGNSWKWLEKKDPEFRDKIQIDWNITTQMSDEDKEIYNKILQKNLKIWNKETKN